MTKTTEAHFSILRKVQEAVADRYEHEIGPGRYTLLTDQYGAVHAILENRGEVVLLSCYDTKDRVHQVNLDSPALLNAVHAAIGRATFLNPSPEVTEGSRG